MKLSVITPCYNGEKFIAQAIRSFCEQHMDDEAEMIVVDDGSTDSSPEICMRLAANIPNLRYFRTENHGAAAARNFGIEQAKGEWVAFVDQDDLLLPGALPGLVKAAYRGGYSLIFTPKCFCDVGLTHKARIIMPDPLSRMRHHIPAQEFWVCICRRQFLLDNKIRHYEGAVDVESSFRYQLFSRAERVLRVTDRAFYLQRNNLESNSHTWNHTKLWLMKAMAYYDLHRTTAIEADKAFLLKVAYCQYLDARRHRHEAFPSDDRARLDELMRLGKEMEQAIPPRYRAVRIAAMRAEHCLNGLINRLRRLKHQMLNRQQRASTATTDGEQLISDDELMRRLSIINEDICRRLSTPK